MVVLFDVVILTAYGYSLLEILVEYLQAHLVVGKRK